MTIPSSSSPLKPSLPPLFFRLQYVALAIAPLGSEIDVCAYRGEGQGCEQESAVAAERWSGLKWLPRWDESGELGNGGNERKDAVYLKNGGGG